MAVKSVAGTKPGGTLKGIPASERFARTRVVLLILAAAFAVLTVLGVLQATGVWKTAAVHPGWEAPIFYGVLLVAALSTWVLLPRLGAKGGKSVKSAKSVKSVKPETAKDSTTA